MQKVALFKERLVARRNRLGLTQVDLAQKGNFAPRSVASWESGESNPTLDNLEHLAATLGVSVAWLIGEAEANVTRETFEEPPSDWGGPNSWLAVLKDATLSQMMADLSRINYDPVKDAEMLEMLSAVVGELRRRGSAGRKHDKVSSKSDVAAAEAARKAAAAARLDNPKPKQ